MVVMKGGGGVFEGKREPMLTVCSMCVWPALPPSSLHTRFIFQAYNHTGAVHNLHFGHGSEPASTLGSPEGHPQVEQ